MNNQHPKTNEKTPKIEPHKNEQTNPPNSTEQEKGGDRAPNAKPSGGERSTENRRTEENDEEENDEEAAPTEGDEPGGNPGAQSKANRKATEL